VLPARARQRRAALRDPLSERLLYAGEAAAADGWHATVAGAYLSGRQAAAAVLARLDGARRSSRAAS